MAANIGRRIGLQSPLDNKQLPAERRKIQSSQTAQVAVKQMQPKAGSCRRPGKNAHDHGQAESLAWGSDPWGIQDAAIAQACAPEQELCKSWDAPAIAQDTKHVIQRLGSPLAKVSTE